MTEALNTTMLNLLENMKISEEILNEAINRMDLCVDPKAFLLLIELKEKRICQVDNIARIRFSTHQIEKIFYCPTKDLDTLCTVISRIFGITENLDEVSSDLICIFHKEMQNVEEDQHFRVVKIINSFILRTPICTQYTIKSFDLRNGAVKDFLLKYLSMNSFSNTRNFIISELLPNYLQIIDRNLVTIFLDIILIISTESLRLDVLCGLLTKQKLKDEIFRILNKSEFYEFLSNSMTVQTFLQKEAVFILQTLINCTEQTHVKYPYLTSNQSDFRKSWQAFFTLVEAAKEKQLHLIKPSIFLLNDIKSLHRIWWVPVFTLFLEHPQTSVVYEVAKYIVTDWPIDFQYIPTEEYESQLKMFVKLLLKAINRNEYSSSTKEFFWQFGEKCEILHSKYNFVILSEISHYNWSPTALWNVFTSVLTKSHIICNDYIDTLLNIALNLPHVYIRRGCVKLLIDLFTVNHESYHNLFKCIKILKDKDFYLYLYFVKNKLSVCVKGVVLEKIVEKEFGSLNYEQLIFDLELVRDMGMVIEYLVQQALDAMNEDMKLYLYIDFLKYFAYEEVSVYLKIFFKKYLTLSNVESWYKLMTKLFDNTAVENKLLFLNKWVPYLNNHNDIHKNVKIALYSKLIVFNTSIFGGEKCDDIRENITVTINSHFLDLRNNAIENWRENEEKYPKWVEIELLDAYIMTVLPMEVNTERTVEFIISLMEKDEDLEKYAFQFICNLIHQWNSCENVDDSRLLYYLEVFVKYMTKLKSNKDFTVIVQNFISSLYTPQFYNIMQSNIDFERNLTKTLEDMYITQPCIGDVWVKLLYTRMQHVKYQTKLEFITPLMDLYLYGTCVKKEDRIEYNVCKEVHNALANTVVGIDNPNKRSTSIRMCALETLCIMISNVDDPNHSVILEQMITDLYRRYVLDNRKRYFPDSESHFVKLRIFQAILILINFASTANLKYLYQYVYKLLDIFVTDPQQNDVRQIMQWCVLFATHKLGREMQQGIFNTIVNLLKNEKKESPSICTLILLLYHLTIAFKEENFYSCTVEILLPWTMGATFKARVHAQEAIKGLISTARANRYEIFFRKYGYLEQVIISCIRSSHAAFYETLKTDLVLYASFDFIVDYSIESIFYQIPKLNRTFSYEWDNILDHKFENRALKINNKTPNLNNAVVAFLETPARKEINVESSQHFNFQLKITPWKNNILNSPPAVTDSFILVASLIDKPQNLGGLMRTCEVYGIKQIVLHDGKVVGSKEFKSLSMSSEHWVDILEVKVPSLEDFLKSMKKKSFTIVGAEQTCDSESLSKYKFEKKTVLVLGNEKEGIPPNVLTIMDVCVEIPQLGQIRSLNVHVAGAICIWEYMKQYRL